jgi:hypothetical protein
MYAGAVGYGDLSAQVVWRGVGVGLVGQGLQRDIAVSEHARAMVEVRLKRTNA